jgi:hypothetical protein
MSNVIRLFAPDIAEGLHPPKSSIPSFNRKKAAQTGWNNRFCENCGRPYTQPPPWSSFPHADEHPLWPEWILTSYCNKGLCNGVRPRGECKPRLVKTEQTEPKK